MKVLKFNTKTDIEKRVFAFIENMLIKDCDLLNNEYAKLKVRLITERVAIVKDKAKIYADQNKPEKALFHLRIAINLRLLEF